MTTSASGSYSGSLDLRGDEIDRRGVAAVGLTDKKAFVSVMTPLIDPPGQKTLKLTLAVAPPDTVTVCGFAPLLSQLFARPEI